jgi:hypothetical protein
MELASSACEYSHLTNIGADHLRESDKVSLVQVVSTNAHMRLMRYVQAVRHHSQVADFQLPQRARLRSMWTGL